MPVKRTLTGKQFGGKVKELFQLVESTPDWEQYVSEQTATVVKTLYKNKNMTETLEELDMKYTTVRAHLLRAIERIETQKKNYLREGQSEQAQQLLTLMDKPDWKVGLTENEINLAETFKKVRNFYEVGRMLNIKPSNVAITLYGSNQKLGVVGKIQKRQRFLKKMSS